MNNEQYMATCFGKQALSTGDAKKAVKRATTNGRTAHIFKCVHCKMWHLAHKPARDRTMKCL